MGAKKIAGLTAAVGAFSVCMAASKIDPLTGRSTVGRAIPMADTQLPSKDSGFKGYLVRGHDGKWLGPEQRVYKVARVLGECNRAHNLSLAAFATC